MRESEMFCALENQRDQAYEERNRLVAFMATVYPSTLGTHQGPNWDPDWLNVVFIQTPVGQMSWHIHSRDLHLFSHVVRDESVEWDGHTTEEKYKNLEKLVRTLSLKD